MTKRNKPRRLLHRLYRGLGGSLPAPPPGALLVEYFSDEQLLTWRTRSKEFQHYHYLWYFELEAQRAAKQLQLLDSLREVPGISVDVSGWGRAVQYKYSQAPLSCLGSLKWVGGRFNYGIDIDSTRFAPFPALYLAEDFETGLREMQGLTRDDNRGGLTANELNLCAKKGVAWIAIAGSVANVFDLTSASNLDGFIRVISTFKFSKNVRDMERRMQVEPKRVIGDSDELLSTFLVENWREYPAAWNTPSNPQLFGHLLGQAGFEGVLFSSTRTGKKNLALFARQFKNSASIVRVQMPPASATCCELSAKTFGELEADLAPSPSETR